MAFNVQERLKREPPRSSTSEEERQEQVWTEKTAPFQPANPRTYSLVNAPQNQRSETPPPLSRQPSGLQFQQHLPVRPDNLNSVNHNQGYQTPPLSGNLQNRNFPPGPSNSGYPPQNWLRNRPPQYREDLQYNQPGGPPKQPVGRPSGWSILRERLPTDIRNQGPYPGNFPHPTGRLPIQPNYDPSGLRMQNPGYSYPPRSDRPPSSQGMNPASQESIQNYSPGSGQVPPGDRKMYMQRTDSVIRQQQPMGMNMMRPPEAKSPQMQMRPGEESQELPRAYIAVRPPGVRAMPPMPGSPQTAMRNSPQMNMDGRTTPVDNRPNSANMQRPMMRQMTPPQYGGPPPQSPQMAMNRPPNIGGQKEESFPSTDTISDGKLEGSRQNPYPARPPSRSSDVSGASIGDNTDQPHSMMFDKTDSILEPDNDFNSSPANRRVLSRNESKKNIISQDESVNLKSGQQPDQKITEDDKKVNESRSNMTNAEKPIQPSDKHNILKDATKRDVNGDSSSGHHVKFTPNVEKIGDSSSGAGGDPASKGEQSSRAKRPTSLNQDKRTSRKDEPIGKKDRSSSKEDLKPPKSPSLPNGSPARPENHVRQSMTSPEPQAEKKKVPMNKIHVGAVPSPNLKCIRSKIGSLENATHTPGGGKIKIESKKLDFSKAQSKIAAKNDTYTPGGGEKKIQHQKLQWSAKSKIGSLENASHKPGGGDKKIESMKLDFKDKAKPKVGSKDNIKHIAGGGNVKIEDQKLEIKAQSKVGSFENVKHKPGGGDKKIFDDKKYIRQVSEIYSETLSASNSQGNVNEISPSSSRSKSLDRLKLTPTGKPSVHPGGEISADGKPIDQNYNQVNAAKPPSGKSKKPDNE